MADVLVRVSSYFDESCRLIMLGEGGSSAAGA